MVDRTSRDRLAELLLRLLTDQSKEFLYEGEILVKNSKDLGLQAVYACVWALYDDPNPMFLFYSPLAWRRLSPERRRQMGAAIMYLHSDLEYEWPQNWPGCRGGCLDGLLCFLCGLSIMGGLMLWPLALLSPWLLIIPCVLLIQSPLIYRFSQKLAKRFQLEWETEMGRMGDYEVWPFLRRADFVAAKEKSGFSPGHWPEELGQYG